MQPKIFLNELDDNTFIGQPTELLEALEVHGAQSIPPDATRLTKKVLEISSTNPLLHIQRGKSDGKRVIKVWVEEHLEPITASVHSVPSDPDESQNRDARDARDARTQEESADESSKEAQSLNKENPPRTGDVMTPEKMEAIYEQAANEECNHPPTLVKNCPQCCLALPETFRDPQPPTSG